MRIAVVGGGGVRAPLLLKGMIEQHAALPVGELVLFDPASDKLALLEPVCRALLERAGNPFRLRLAGSLAEAVDGTSFVITSIRAGGMAARAFDERLLLDRGLLGQETVGAAGFAKALRTIPPMLHIAETVAERAPAAWIINFTNPVGIITEAVRKATQARIVGICDTPMELFEGIAQALATPLRSLYCDYFGLNHLGWVRRVLKDGTDCLPALLKDNELLEKVYRHRLFDPEMVRSLGLLPSEYLYYYYSTNDAVTNLRRAGRSRAEQIEALNAGLWEELSPSGQPIETYQQYLERRNSSYMSAEASASASSPAHSVQCASDSPTTPSSAAGYDRIALAVMSAIHGDTGAVIPVNVENRGAIESLEDDDVVEVPCVIGRNGPLPLAVGRPPAAVSSLLHLVKHYERLTVHAALTSSAARAAQALAANPLVRDRDLASELVAEFQAFHKDLLGYLR